MSRIEIEYNGFRVAYSENSEVWVCYDLNLEAEKLSGLKAKISKVMAEARRVENVPVIEIGFRNEFAVVTLLDGDEVWIMKSGDDVSGKRNKTRREKVKMTDLVLDTPENRASIEAFEKEVVRIRNLEKANRERLASIPRVTSETLKSING